MANSNRLGFVEPFLGSTQEDWNSWLVQFGQFAELNDISAAKKVPLLLTSIGSKMFRKLEQKGHHTTLSFDEIKAVVEAYYVSNGTPYVAEQKLAMRTRRSGERIEAFIADLRVMAQKCKYDTEKASDKAVLNQIFRG
uniref:Retrotransposon gag domain-containing protein n=1 Tax=Strigamia maritima TaxID=126957 RepID=T1JJ74_STRMM